MRHRLVLNHFDNPRRIRLRRFGGVHRRNDGRRPHGRIEQTEKRKAREIDASWLDPVAIAYQVDLRVEHTVFVNDTFGRPRTAAGKDDGGRIGRPHRHGFKGLPWRTGQRPIRGPAPEPPRTDREVVPCVPEPSTVEQAHGMDGRDGKEAFRFRLFEAVQHLRESHSRVDQNDDGPRLERREDERHELDAKPHHEHEPRERGHTDRLQAAGQAVAFAVELLKRQMRIGKPTRRVAARRKDDGPLMRNNALRSR